jgi:acyl-CoA hydrolase
MPTSDALSLHSDTPSLPTDGTGRHCRFVADSADVTALLMLPTHANHQGTVFGGVILSEVDRLAALIAYRHARLACVTVSVDRVDFRKPIKSGAIVRLKGSVNYAGRTSMEIGIRIESEDALFGTITHTNSCYLTFVAVDADGKPVAIPGLIPTTPDEVRRNHAAVARRERRLAERIAESGPGR